jgi:predicted RNase H-like HicB family nuclease
MSTTYDVRVTREDGAWLADVPAVEGAHTYARSLPGLKKSVREVIILMDDLDDNADVDMRLSFHGTDQAITDAVKVGQQRRAIAEQEAEVMASTASSVTELIKVGYSVRDVAELLHITAGRVSQIANG